MRAFTALSFALLSLGIGQASARAVSGPELVPRCVATEVRVETQEEVKSCLLSKRAVQSPGDKCLSALIKYKAQPICKALCPAPTVTRKVTSTCTKTTSVTRTATSTKTATAQSNAKITTTLITTATEVVLTTSCPGGCDRKTVTETAAPTTATKTTTVYETFSSTLPPITITVTIGVPTQAVAPRAVQTPAYLRGFPSSVICKACSKFAPARTLTVTSTVKTTTTSTKVVLTTTVKTTVTRTNVATRTATAYSTASATVTSTISSDAPTTTETTTPLVTATATETVTITEAFTPSPVTTSVCPSQTNGVSGISVVSGGVGHLEYSSARSVTECCAACYAAQGCSGWAFIDSCFYDVEDSPRAGTPTDVCPFGLGGYALFLEPAFPQYAGGPGPCYTG